MVTVSPPVSPSVVARILMIQKPSVIAGTLLRAAVVSPVGSIRRGSDDRRLRRQLRKAGGAPLSCAGAQERAVREGSAHMGAKFVTICAAGLLVGGCFKEKPRDLSAISKQQIHDTFARWASAF